jgi:hypothetical protein
LEVFLHLLNTAASELTGRETVSLLEPKECLKLSLPKVVNKICAAHYTEYLLLEGRRINFTFILPVPQHQPATGSRLFAP